MRSGDASPRHFARSATEASLTLLLAGVLSACGGSSSMNPAPNPSPTPAAKTAVQVNMGDAPADWMLAFSMNISSMSLTGSNGSVSAVSSAMPMEMMHLMGTMQPIAMVSAPQGTYTGASISIGSATVVYMDPSTKTPVQKTISGPMTATVTFSNPVTVGSAPMALGFDLDLAKSIAADTSGNLSMNPVFHITAGMQGSGSPLDPSDGGIQRMMGAVSGVSGSTFTMTSMQAAQSFTFMTNSSTEFDNTRMSAMTNGMLLLVDASLQSDGSLLAARVQSMMGSGGVMGGGIVTAVTGPPATQFTMVMQDGAGTGMMASNFAAEAAANLNGSTVYKINDDGMDMSSLPFTPVFDSNHVFAGQSLMPISSSGMMSGGMGGGMMGGGMMAGTITASEVDLEQQGLSGTVAAATSSGARTTLTLTLPSDSAFRILTGASSVIVCQQPGTMIPASPIAAGATVHAYGLLFLDAGQWKMVASRIAALP